MRFSKEDGIQNILENKCEVFSQEGFHGFFLRSKDKCIVIEVIGRVYHGTDKIGRAYEGPDPVN